MTNSLIATSPTEMVANQNSLMEWCDQKIAVEQQEIGDLEANLAIAKANKWRVKPWQSRISRARRKILFFEKVKQALQAGYYIVPPFPVQVFAIRTDAQKPQAHTTTWVGATHEQSAKRLPPGDGDYVSNLPEVWQRDIDWVEKGEKKTGTQYFAKAFRDVDFPFSFAKPQVLEATSKAMALKLFDQMGVLPRFGRAGGDPIVVGQILHPSQYREPLTFFVAWWMNSDDL